MSVYPPPIDQGTIFNPIDYGLGSSTITIDYLNANYLKFPVAQGFESMVGISNFDELDMNSNKIIALGTPTLATDAATKGYVDTGAAAKTLAQTLTAGNSAGSSQINMNNNKIVSLATPTDATDAATKGYVDTASSANNLNWATGFLAGQLIQTGTTNDAFNMGITATSPVGSVFGTGYWLFLCQVPIEADATYAYNCPSCTAYVQFYSTATPPVLLGQTMPAGSCYYDDLARGQGLQNSNINISQMLYLSAAVGYVQLRISAGNTTGSNHNMSFYAEWQAIRITN